MTLTWSIAESTLPDYLTESDVARVVRKAMDYVSKASGNQVRFVEGGSLGNHITFEFKDFHTRQHIGWWKPVGNHNFVVSFNTQARWAASWWHYLIGRNESLYTLAVHEIGHVLGLYRKASASDATPHHNDDEGSVMHATPRFSRFTSNDIALLRTLTR